MRSFLPTLRLAPNAPELPSRAKFGGLPWGVPPWRWPACRECGQRGHRGGWFADLPSAAMMGRMTDWLQHFQAGTAGMAVAHVWRGYGTALFLEFGRLTPAVGQRRDGSSRPPVGQIGAMIEADWRIVHGNRIVCGSADEEELWSQGFAHLLGRRVTALTTFGHLPELAICLTGAIRVESLTGRAGDPAWTLFDRRGEPVTVGCRAGAVVRDA